MQLRHEQSIAGSLRGKIKMLKKELKQSRQYTMVTDSEQLQYRFDDAMVTITPLRDQLKNQNAMIDNVKANEREKLEMQFKVIFDEQDSRLNVHIAEKERLQQECAELIEELQQSTKHQKKQNQALAVHEEKQKRVQLYDEFLQNLQAEQRQQLDGRDEENLSSRIIEKIRSDWIQISGDADVDLDAKKTESRAFFSDMDSVVQELSNQLQSIKRRLKAQQIPNSEECEEEEQDVIPHPTAELEEQEKSE